MLWLETQRMHRKEGNEQRDQLREAPLKEELQQ